MDGPNHHCTHGAQTPSVSILFVLAGHSLKPLCEFSVSCRLHSDAIYHGWEEDFCRASSLHAEQGHWRIVMDALVWENELADRQI